MFNQHIRGKAMHVKETEVAEILQLSKQIIPTIQVSEPEEKALSLSRILGISRERAAALFYAWNIYLI